MIKLLKILIIKLKNLKFFNILEIFANISYIKYSNNFYLIFYKTQIKILYLKY